VFSSFEHEPIGAASIGQVHKAVIRKTGQPVVVKVQYPEVESLFRGDVKTLILFCNVVQPVHVPALEEIEKQFMTEFNYEEEGKKLQLVRENLIRGGLSPPEGNLNYIANNFNRKNIHKCILPEPYPEYCSKNVLVMSEIAGVKLADGLKADFEKFANCLGTSVEELRRQKKEKEDAGIVEGKVPTSVEMDSYLSLLNKKRQISNLIGFTTHMVIYPLQYLLPESIRPNLYKHKTFESTIPLNHARLIDDLIDIHGHEILIDGYYNGDCHPGNILLLNDANKKKKGQPQLGLIDYGQTKSLSAFDRVLLAKMVIALCNKDKEMCADLLIRAGYRTKYMRRDLMYLYAQVTLDQDNKTVTQGMHIKNFMEWMQAEDPVIELPREVGFDKFCVER